ncbi:hypothetical protein GW17_00042358 [Ensete ventricosum]|nr:hypothetical protein GW17_00042358 [Ensete ventricosum]
MLNSVERDHIFSSMRLSKGSNLALMASSNAMVLASRSIMLSLGMTVEARVAAIVGIAWKSGGDKDGSKGNGNTSLIPDEPLKELYRF